MVEKYALLENYSCMKNHWGNVLDVKIIAKVFSIKWLEHSSLPSSKENIKMTIGIKLLDTCEYI